jgi:hypothetical protein
MITGVSTANGNASLEAKPIWKKPRLRRLDAREAETGIFLGPELITELS